ncbi:coiled-coil domain-containing 16 [Pyrrhoderma noxium]|uniref:Coiled-coil domain-containing 16 n=1 Tax=Pyrrhoderma noxium TaxID=2282107 RepID=A0A286UAL4_9AGAM|nr:coiled-coil domain-containing 16 [Pyrrhoderma noxium]
MSDARTLLRAKRQEARIQHPFAAYTSSGQLRCTACSSSIKSASMWEGHLGSKPHRLAVSRLREAEAAKAQALAEQEETRRGKRKAEDADMDMDVDDIPQDSLRVSESTKKRRTSEEPTTTTTTTSSSTSVSASKPSKSGFPADFFSDPSQAPVLSTLDSEDESDSEAPHPSATTTTNNTTQTPSAPKSQLDLEWEAFQASLTASADREEDQKIAYERATVFAEPELAPSAINGGTSGFPPNTGPGTFNNASSEGAGQQGQQGQQEEAGKEEDEEETEEEKRARKEREERELIMDRLIEEERLQEEADERVGLLKARVEALKRAREAKRASKSSSNKS